MAFWIMFLNSLPLWLWFGLLAYLSGIYMCIIAPIIFNSWIIPKIENRYHREFKTNSTAYPAPFGRYTNPPMETSIYIVLKYLGIHWKIFEYGSDKYPDNKTLYAKYNKANFDIKEASKSEIVMSFITIFFLVCFLVSCVVVSSALN